MLRELVRDVVRIELAAISSENRNPQVTMAGYAIRGSKGERMIVGALFEALKAWGDAAKEGTDPRVPIFTHAVAGALAQSQHRIAARKDAQEHFEKLASAGANILSRLNPPLLPPK